MKAGRSGYGLIWKQILTHLLEIEHKEPHLANATFLPGYLCQSISQNTGVVVAKRGDHTHHWLTVRERGRERGREGGRERRMLKGCTGAYYQTKL